MALTFYTLTLTLTLDLILMPNPYDKFDLLDSNPNFESHDILVECRVINYHHPKYYRQKRIKHINQI